MLTDRLEVPASQPAQEAKNEREGGAGARTGTGGRQIKAETSRARTEYGAGAGALVVLVAAHLPSEESRETRQGRVCRCAAVVTKAHGRTWSEGPRTAAPGMQLRGEGMSCVLFLFLRACFRGGWHAVGTCWKLYVKRWKAGLYLLLSGCTAGRDGQWERNERRG